MSKTIKISKESVERFNHDKNVAGAKNEARRVKCPINNRADMHSDEMLNALFDDGAYVEHLYDCFYYVELGFIDGLPVSVKWAYGLNVLSVKLTKEVQIYDIDPIRFSETLRKRLTDEHVDAEVEFYDSHDDYSDWGCKLFYNEQWCKENLG